MQCPKGVTDTQHPFLQGSHPGKAARMLEVGGVELFAERALRAKPPWSRQPLLQVLA